MCQYKCLCTFHTYIHTYIHTSYMYMYMHIPVRVYTSMFDFCLLYVSYAGGCFSPKQRRRPVSKQHYLSHIPCSMFSDELDEKVNYLEVQEISTYLKFSREDDGTFTLRGGPLDALIAYAGSTSTEGCQVH